MRILDRYLYKELFSTFFAVLLVLLLITFGTEATKLLAIAVEGKMPSSVLFQVLLLKIPPALEVILPLVALLSVMLAIGRLYQDQEMVVLNACGIAPGYFQKRIFWFIFPLLLLTAWITLFVTPWSFHKERSLITQAQSQSPLAALVAGKFNELPNGEGVLYVQKIDSSFDLNGVWIRLKTPEQDVVMMAPKGRFEWIKGRLALVLLKGIAYHNLHTPQQSIQVRKFERFEGFLPQIQVTPPAKNKLETPTQVLLHSQKPADTALLQWRMVIPLSVLVMGLLGLKMSRSNPREGRFAKVFFALVLYVVYNQLLVTTNEALSKGEWPAQIGLWPIPILFLVFAFYQGKLWPSRWALPDLKRLFS